MLVTTQEFEQMTEGQQNIVLQAEMQTKYEDIAKHQDFDHAEYLYAKLPHVPYDCVGIDVTVRYSGKQIRIERYSSHKTLGLSVYRVKEGKRTTRKGFFMGENEMINWLSMLQETVA